jgi:predicted HTH domain antitoxin
MVKVKYRAGHGYTLRVAQMTGRRRTMSQILLEVPEESLRALQLSPQAFADELRLAAAVKLFEVGRLSSGGAAQLAGVSRPLFLSRLADYGVDTFRLTEEELQQETRLARSNL